MSKRFTFRKKRPFTLLELLLSITILGLIGSVLAFSSLSLIRSARFDKEMRAFVLTLQEMRTLSLSYQCEIALVLSKNSSGCSYVIQTEQPFPLRKTGGAKELISVSSFAWDGASIEKTTLLFSSTGSLYQPGVLTFRGDEREFTVYLDSPPQISTIPVQKKEATFGYFLEIAEKMIEKKRRVSLI